ncbi:MAG: T9SS type A sorting domain-containing protein [Candidatus Zixiibacteriota bacterium]
MISKLTKSLAAIAVTFMLLSLPSTESNATEYFWTGDSSNSWHNPHNWSPNGVPQGAGDTANIIKGGTDYTIVADTFISVQVLHINSAGPGVATIQLNGNTLTTIDESTIGSAGRIRIDRGVIDGTGPLIVYGLLDLLASTVYVSIINHGTFNVRGGSLWEGSAVNADLDNYGVINNSQSRFTFNGAFTNNSSASLIIYGDAAHSVFANGFTNDGLIDLRGRNLTINDGPLENAGTFRITGGVYNGLVNNSGFIDIGGTTTVNAADSVLTNSGTINVKKGMVLTYNFSSTDSTSSPGLTSTGTIDIDSGAVLLMKSGSFDYDFGGLINAGTIRVESGSFDLHSDHVNSDSSIIYLFNNSSLNGPGKLTNYGSLYVGGVSAWNGSSVTADLDNFGNVYNQQSRASFQGVFTNQTSGSIHISSRSTFSNGFTNDGLIDLSGILNINNGAIDNMGTVLASGQYNGVLHNSGLLTVEGALSVNTIDSVLTNSGTINVKKGMVLTYNFSSTDSTSSPGLTSTGTIDIDSGAVLLMKSGSFDYDFGGLINAGTIRVESGSFDLHSDHVNSDSSIIYLFNNSSLNGPGKLTNYGSLYVGGVSAWNGSSVTADLDNFGNVYNQQSRASFQGVFTNQTSGSIHISSRSTFSNGFTNDGLIDLSGILNINNGAIDNMGTVLASGQYNGVLHNSGLLTVEGALSVNTIDSVLTNSGTINVKPGKTLTCVFSATDSTSSPGLTSSGSIEIGSGATVTVKNGVLTNSNSGIVKGHGALDITKTTCINNGTIAPGASPGILTVKDILPQSASSKVDIELGGKLVGDEYDQLHVVSTAILDGELNVSLIDNFVPAIGDTFVVLTSSDRRGHFASLSGMGQRAVTMFDLVYSGDDVLLVTTDVPNQAPAITGLPDTLYVFAGETDTVAMFDFVEDDKTPDAELFFQYSIFSDSITISSADSSGWLMITTDSLFASNTTVAIMVEDHNTLKAYDTIVVATQLSTAVYDRISDLLPSEFELSQNYPNPFNPSTAIEFALPERADVALTVYNILGQEVERLVDDRLAAGYYRVDWDADRYASGLYFYRLISESVTNQKKMMLVK